MRPIGARQTGVVVRGKAEHRPRAGVISIGNVVSVSDGARYFQEAETFAHYLHPEDPAPHQAPNRGPGMGW